MSDNPTAKDEIVIEHIFDVPIDQIWKMWVDPEHFKNWYGPKGASVPIVEMDVRVGGKRLVCMEMQTPGGNMKMWTTGEFKEIVPNQLLVYTDSMADENGNVISPAAMGMPEGYPETTQVMVQLEDLEGRTKMVMTHTGVPAATGAEAGWEQAFVKMSEYIGDLQ
jgi:uncharacterized protein YndB with AHSA1/START domain